MDSSTVIAVSVSQRKKQYQEKVLSLQQQFRDLITQGLTPRLHKSTSNLFRATPKSTSGLNVSHFNQVLSIDEENHHADVEGMITFDALTQETLKRLYLPAVVPELKTITVAGALVGVGIESSSFRYGLVHQTIVEFDLLLASGEVITCRADNDHHELFYAMANSYGTFGTVLRCVIQLIPARPFVHCQYQSFDNHEDFYQALQTSDADYLDGVIFSAKKMIVARGYFVQQASSVSQYGYRRIYYRSLLERREDTLSAYDYVWRYDADWFWCSRVLGMQWLPLRLLLGKWCLHSAFYHRCMRWFQQRAWCGMLYNAFFGQRESVIQDVAIPVEKAAEFLQFFHQHIGILPIWQCPVEMKQRYPLFPLMPNQRYINFGFWDSVKTDKAPGFYNRLIEDKVTALGGLKSLYSSSYYTEAEFWTIFDKAHLDKLKRQYDPRGVLRDLYQTCVASKESA